MPKSREEAPCLSERRQLQGTSHVKARSIKAVAAAALGLAAVALVVVPWKPQHQELLEEGLEQHLMSQDSRHAVWSQSHDKIFETEGHSVTSKLRPWTGKSTHAFNRLKSISSNPVDEALAGIHDSLSHSLGRGKHDNFFSSWGNTKSSSIYGGKNYYHEHDTFGDKMQKLRQKQDMERRRENSNYFKGVEKAFGKKAGKALEEAFGGEKRGLVSKMKLDPKQLAAKQEAVSHSAKVPSTKKQDRIAASQHKVHNLKHLGVVADTKKMKKLVHEFNKASGKDKAKLKARVMELQQDIVSSFKKVTDYGERAQTKLSRETAKEKAKAKAKE